MDGYSVEMEEFVLQVRYGAVSKTLANGIWVSLAELYDLSPEDPETQEPVPVPVSNQPVTELRCRVYTATEEIGIQSVVDLMSSVGCRRLSFEEFACFTVRASAAFELGRSMVSIGTLVVFKIVVTPDWDTMMRKVNISLPDVSRTFPPGMSFVWVVV